MNSAQPNSARIKVAIGKITFSGKGDAEWLAKQLDKVLEAVSKHHLEETEIPDQGNSGAKLVSSELPSMNKNEVGTLATFLKTKDATTNQTKRFLATAAWLTKKGSNTIKTSDVSKALRDNHQSRLGNPSDCLNQNVKKGFCEKTADSFFVTPEGWDELGEKS
ncbi:MAG: hypothetical protein AAGA53_15860 [Pseudomonadota bacterium]